MVAPALTVEKERQTLPLLFLARFGPTMLLVEKLVRRLIPMSSLIRLSLPLLMIAWLSLWIGMVCRAATRAILLSGMAVVACCAIPALLVAWLETEYPMWRHQCIGWLFLSNPAAIVPLKEFSEFFTGMNPWLATTINFLFYGSLTLFSRHVAINTASHWLKRPE
jgi:hypothetical protein